MGGWLGAWVIGLVEWVRGCVGWSFQRLWMWRNISIELGLGTCEESLELQLQFQLRLRLQIHNLRIDIESTLNQSHHDGGCLGSISGWVLGDGFLGCLICLGWILCYAVGVQQRHTDSKLKLVW